MHLFSEFMWLDPGYGDRFIKLLATAFYGVNEIEDHLSVRYFHGT